jgi:hypothetical protein
MYICMPKCQKRLQPLSSGVRCSLNVVSDLVVWPGPRGRRICMYMYAMFESNPGHQSPGFLKDGQDAGPY